MTIITSVKLSEDEYNFCKSNGLQFSALLREAIFNHKQVIEGVIVDNVQEERRKREKFQQMMENLRDFIQKENPELLAKYLEEKK